MSINTNTYDLGELHFALYRLHFYWQVPKGWDKLLVSIVSMQTGKTIAKLGKASVRNGNCRWTETLTESLPVSQLEGNPKELEECLLKFSVTMVRATPK